MTCCLTCDCNAPPPPLIFKLQMAYKRRSYKARACALHAKDFKQARKEFMDVAKKLTDVHAFVAFAALLQVCVGDDAVVVAWNMIC